MNHVYKLVLQIYSPRPLISLGIIKFISHSLSYLIMASLIHLHFCLYAYKNYKREIALKKTNDLIWNDTKYILMPVLVDIFDYQQIKNKE